MKFLKMHGIGNDFVILDERKTQYNLNHAQIQSICDRNRGVGCDQLIIMEVANRGDVFMRIFNSDGSESDTCGNATRCVADLFMEERDLTQCLIETRAGVLACRRISRKVIEVDMGVPGTERQDIPIFEDKDTLNLGIGKDLLYDPVALSMGNPHCVFFVNDLDAVDIHTFGPHFENHPLFPEKTNVEFAQVLNREQIRLRTWERGAGLTLACGSAACATAVAAVRRGLADRIVEVHLDGGSLKMHWREEDDHILMTGPVAYVFEGELYT